MTEDKRAFDLIMADVDGEIDSTGAAELAALAERNPEVGAALQDYRDISRRLDTMEMADPPPEIGSRIRAALAPPQREASREGRGWSWLLPRAPRYALAFALGFVVSALVLRASGPSASGGIDATQLVGTLAGQREGSQAGDTIRLSSDAISATISVDAQAGYALLNLDLRPDTAVEIRFDLSDPDIRLVGLADRGATLPAIASMNDVLTFFSDREERLAVLLSNGGASERSVTVSIYSSGELIESAELAIAPTAGDVGPDDDR